MDDNSFAPSAADGARIKKKNRARKAGKAQRVCRGLSTAVGFARIKKTSKPRFKNPIPRKLPKLSRHPYTTIEGV
jgi:hypothetical protein